VNLEGLRAIEDIPRDARPYMVVEQDSPRLQRVGGVVLQVPRRTAVLFFLRDDGTEYQTVVDMGEPTRRAPAVYWLGKNEWAQFIDLQKWREAEGGPERRSFEDMTRQWLTTIMEAQEAVKKAHVAASTFGPGGKVQRE
jgi:hypothetical protein